MAGCNADGVVGHSDGIVSSLKPTSLAESFPRRVSTASLLRKLHEIPAAAAHRDAATRCRKDTRRLQTESCFKLELYQEAEQCVT